MHSTFVLLHNGCIAPCIFARARPYLPTSYGVHPHPQTLMCALTYGRAVEETSNAMALDGIMFEGVSVRCRRPNDYNAQVGPTSTRMPSGEMPE